MAPVNNMGGTQAYNQAPENNFKQRRFVSELLKGKTQKAAAVAAGYSEESGSKLIKNPTVQHMLHKSLNDVGITDELIAKKLREGLDAKAPPRKDGGKQYADQFVRKQFLDVIFKLRGDYAPEKSEHINKTINLTIDKGFIAGLKETGFITSVEADVLDAEIVNEESGKVIGQLESGTV